MVSAQSELYAALFARFAGNARLVGLLGGKKIFDQAPVGGTFPYVIFSSILTKPWGTQTDQGEEHMVTLHVFSSNSGKKEAEHLVGEILFLLHDPLFLPSFHLVSSSPLSWAVKRLSDKPLFQGEILVRFVTECLFDFA